MIERMRERSKGKILGVFILIVAVELSLLYSLGPERGKHPTFQVGERQVYWIYLKGEKIGILSYQINGKDVVGRTSYVATFSLHAPGQVRRGELKFNNNGKLWQAIVDQAENNTLKWLVKVGYSFRLGWMRATIVDNRVPGNCRKADNLIELGKENIMMPEHIWYFLRPLDLKENSRVRLRINLLPNPLKGRPIRPAQNTMASFEVIGSETIKTPAGKFKTWVIEGGENNVLATWPIDKLWIAKDEKFVVKAIEWLENVQFQYELNSYASS